MHEPERSLARRGMPGRWRSDASPWVRPVMEDFSNAAARDIAVQCAAQCAKTQTVMNCACWAISEDSGPAIVGHDVHSDDSGGRNGRESQTKLAALRDSMVSAKAWIAWRPRIAAIGWRTMPTIAATAVQSSPTRSAVVLAGWLALSFTAAAMGALFLPGEWYAGLQKPAWNPPSWIFAPVWTALYTTMAIAAWLVWRRGGFAGQRVALSFFLTQLLFNALWSPLFFGLHHPGLALVDIALLWLALLGTVAAFWSASPIAGALLLPYLVWVTFASALNLALWRLNH